MKGVISSTQIPDSPPPQQHALQLISGLTTLITCANFLPRGRDSAYERGGDARRLA